MSSPEISVVIITWKAKNFLKECLQSLPQGMGNLPYEVIIIDNASNDGTIEMVEQEFPDYTLIKNKENLGVAKARNIGIRNSKGKKILILDVDTVVTKDSIKILSDFLDKTKDAGIVGPKMLDRSGNLQYTCRNHHTILTFIMRRLTFLPFVENGKVLRTYLMKDWDHSHSLKVCHTIGACQLIKKELFEELGLLDESMFYGWEDTDFCVRAERAGYSTYYVPDAVIYHYEQRITKKSFLNRHFFENIKSMLIFFRKYPKGLWGNYKI